MLFRSDPTTVGRHWAIPSSLAEVLPAEANQWTTQEKLDFLHAKGCIYIPREGKGQPKYKQYIGSGIPYQDVWACQPYTEGTLYESDECIDADVKWLGHERERLGYPTQKPEGLLDRIIRSSSPDGALVLDPFCGCGTAVAVSQRLNRRWIGIDITHLAVNLIKVRLRDAFGPKVDETYRVVGEPTTAADAAQLAKEEPYQFQWWALGLVGARPATSDRKKGADRGIDGRLFFHDGSDSGGEAGDVKQVILSVKAGENLNVSMVRDLVGVLDREKDSGAALGVVISMEEPTKPMRQEAAGAGFYRSPAGTQHPRIQLLTVGELLAGKTIDMPPWRDVRTFKKAPKSKGKATSQTQLGFGGE